MSHWAEIDSDNVVITVARSVTYEESKDVIFLALEAAGNFDANVVLEYYEDEDSLAYDEYLLELSKNS